MPVQALATLSITPETLVAEPGKPALLIVALGGAYELGGDRLLLIRGVPAAFSVDNAVKVGDTWGVSFVNSLTRIRLVPAIAYTGQFMLQVQLLEAGEPTISTMARVEYRPLRPSPGPSAVKPGEPLETAATNPAPAFDFTMHARGDALLEHGDIEGARLVFEHLASKGDGLAARKMGRTFDPLFLKDKFIIGIEPKPGTALEWYARADELGYREPNPAAQAADR